MPAALRRSLTLLLLAALTLPAVAAARPHGVHGTIRRVCADTVVRHWVGGPVAGRLARGTRVRRFDLGPRFALGVTNHHRPVLRGYVARSAFCRPTAEQRREAERARALAAARGRGRPAQRLARPVLRRVCADEVYLRDRPLNRAVDLLYRGEAILTDRRARNPWRGGLALGHARKRGWVPEGALCRGIARRLPDHAFTPVAAVPGLRVLLPPAAPSCAPRIAGRRLLQVGAALPPGDDVVVTARVERAGRPVSVAGARFDARRRTDFAAAGPFACGRTSTVVYEVRRAGRLVATLRHAVLPRNAPATARRTGGVVGRAAAACDTPTGKAFAHGPTGAVRHQFHVRPALSATGRFVAFESPGRLLPADTDRARDVYRRDLVTGRLTLVSAGRGAGTSRAPAISADGSIVAFESTVPGLVPEDHDHERDVFVADLAAGTTRRVGQAARTPALSADGTRVAFERTGAEPAILVARVIDGAALRTLPRGYRPALSGDGAVVAFETREPVGPRDANHRWDIARAAVAGGAPELVSAGRDGRTHDGDALAASLGRDGRVVAFQSDAPGLVRADRNGLRDVFVRDVAAGRTTRVSVDRCGGDADGYSRYPALSADGRRVLFDSHASDLLPGDTDGRGHVYVADVRPGARPRLVDARPGGAPSARTAFSPALAADGSTAAFPSFGYDLGPRDANHRVDVYTRRLAGRRIRRAG